MLPPGTIVVPLLNHLLEREDWARQRLRPFSGQTAQIEGGPINLVMTVDDTGLFRAAKPEEAPTVTISFGPEAPVKLLTEPAALFASARLSGAANFAEKEPALGLRGRSRRGNWRHSRPPAGTPAG